VPASVPSSAHVFSSSIRNPSVLISACIFDLDGVIVDTARYHYLAWSRLAKELNIPFNEQDNEQLKGVSRMKSLDILLSLDGRKAGAEEKERMATLKNKWFVEYISGMDRSEIFPGVDSLLKELKSNGIRVALASSSKNAPQVVQILGITKAFEVTIDGTMVKHAKPDPEIFLLAAQELNVSPANCVVIEDAAAGVDAAHAAGMKCIGVGSAQLLKAAELVVAVTGEINQTVLSKL
jgi:beta-phosphoglucomutase